MDDDLMKKYSSILVTIQLPKRSMVDVLFTLLLQVVSVLCNMMLFLSLESRGTDC